MTTAGSPRRYPVTSPQTTESTTALPHERVEPKDTASAPFVARHTLPR